MSGFRLVAAVQQRVGLLIGLLGPIHADVTTLVGKLDQVVDLLGNHNEESVAQMGSIIAFMHGTSIVGLSLALICRRGSSSERRARMAESVVSASP